MNRQKIASLFKHSTKTPHANNVGSPWFTPGWIMTLSIVQIIITMVLVSLFFIAHDLQQISNCVLNIKNFGYGQYDLVSLGLLIAGPIYQCILCLEALFQRRACCLYAVLAFELWLVIYSSIQSKQHTDIIKEAATCQFTVNQMNEATTVATDPMINYSIVGVTCVCFILFLFMAIYFRTSFQQSMDPVHGALASLLKLDFYMTFAYAIQLLPVPMLMTTTTTDDQDISAAVVGVAEIGLVLGISCVVFLLAWCMVLVTWHPLSWWRIMLHMVGLAILCLAGITYLCYRLVRFVLDPRTLAIRYALVFTSVCLVVVLLLTMSIVTTCAVQQWQTRSFPRHHQQQQQQQQQQQLERLSHSPDANKAITTDDNNKSKEKQLDGDSATSLVHGGDGDNDDDICLFLTPQTSRHQ